jgi:enamine deaminase RidA (YjgF/YER057c/UK114 family)
MTPEEKLAELGLSVPEIPPAVGNYVGAVRVGNILFVSGHGPFKDGAPTFIGKLGRDVSVEEGQQAAQLVALNMLASIKEAVGDLDRIARVVKVVGFVASDPSFTGQPGVVNGASELFGDVFGDAGVHARSAVGVVALPLGAPVEVEVVLHVRD